MLKILFLLKSRDQADETRIDCEIRTEGEKENDIKNNDEAKRLKCSAVVEMRKCVYDSKNTCLRWSRIDI